MPLKHQLVHPTAEVALLGLQHGGTPLMSPVCVVTKGSILTPAGWKNMANTSTLEPPFRLFRDGGRTYVQWVGEESARIAAEGRLVKVTLICRDAAKPDTPVFTPCLAFRVAGSPGAGETAISSPVRGVGASGLTSSEGVIIGLVVTCLAITYFVAMTIYIKVRRRKRRAHNRSKLAEEGLRGHSKGRGGGGGGGTGPGDRRSGRASAKPSLVSSEDDSDHEDIVDLSMASRARRANRERNGVTFTTAVVHGEGVGRGTCHEPSDGLERAPRSHLGVVETLGENVRASESRPVHIGTSAEGSGTPVDIHAAQAKKKLYFNPAYFEPEMLQSPPPAALEFLERIREMITIAKSKMKMKMYQPSLVDIQEEDYEHPSRPLSRSTGTCSQMTLVIDELDQNESAEEETKYSSDHSIQSDSLERKSRESDSRSSTLKKLARRVNSQGQSIVSEIIRTLDLKPRLPPVEGVYGFHSPKTRTTKPPPPKPINARIESPNEPDDDFPELIKPSMLRSVLRDGKRLTDLNNTFENFRQEMMATFNRMKRVGEAISPKSSLSRSKNKNKYEASPDSTVEKNKSGTGNGEGKVQKWLQTLESKNSYTRMSEKQNVVFDSRVGLPQKDGLPPPLPEKNSKPPTLPRKNKPHAQRSTSFHEVKDSANNSGDTTKDSITQSQHLTQRNTIARSLSWQNEHRHYDSNPRRPRQQVPILPEDSLNTSYGSEDDSLNDLLSEAESKVPKMTPSDSDSTYSDTKPSRRGSLERKRKNKSEIKSLSRQLPREEEMTVRNQIFNKNTGAKTMSRIAKSDDNPYEKVRSRSGAKDDEEDHTYEEIRFPGEGKQKPKKRAPKAKDNISEIHIDKDSRIEGEASYNIYSNPESHISEVTIPETCSSPVYSGCTVTIPVVDNMNTENEVPSSGFDQDTLEKRGKKVQRNGSIIQDSLERPKVKKNEKSENKDNSSLERKKAQRRMSLPGEASKNKDKSLLDIYESRSSNRSIRNYKHVSPDRSYSPVRFSNPPSKTHGSFYLNNISNVSENNNNIVNNSDTQKKMRTFKDYQEMKFQRNSSDSDVSSSPLPVTGSSINLNFRSSSPNNKEQKEIRPPLPPKNTRMLDNDTSPVLPPKGQNIRPPLPQKSNKKCETDSDSDRPKLPEKSRKKMVTESLSRSSSGGSIPELTEEEARSILHGLLAHTIHDANRLSPLHEEDDTRHFLGLGNTAADSESQCSVPKLSSYSSGSLESSASSSSSSSSSPPSSSKGNQEGDTLGKAVEISLEHQIVNGYGNFEDPGSPGNEAIVNGEFILSTIGRSPSLRRQTSLSREQKSGFLAKLRDMTEDCVENEHMSKGMEIALALKAKTELEKHFKEKSGADSIKRTWRRIIENADDSKEDKDKISIMQLQQYMASLDRKEKETKLKQEDSGYQSTDSSESGNSKALSSTSTVSTASVGSPRPLAPSRSFSSTSLNYRHSNPNFRRSTSLQQLDSIFNNQYSKYEPTFHRPAFLASLDRRHSDSSSTGSSSIYVNNSFTNDDEDIGKIPLGSG
ncbi:uncharacterized protein [Palaemon carinicauda]|uniref:uncharacterized protein n=1 Tax=Palaemon carinicauda TaxID=392227 RepID=UPI0035B69928